MRLKQSRRYIFIVDKDYPPNHSFVDEMIIEGGNYPKSSKNKLYLLISTDKTRKRVFRNGNIVILNILPERKFPYRVLLSPFVIIAVLRRYNKNHSLTVFIRNDPIYLYVSTLFKNMNNIIIYQSSFPHEFSNVNILKRFVSRLLIIISRHRIDKTVTVSERAITRLNRLGINKPNMVVPLLINKYLIAKLPRRLSGDILKCVYIGTHNKERNLELILSAFSDLITQGLPISLETFGALQDDRVRLMNSLKMVKNKEDTIKINGQIDRTEVIDILNNYDIGVCLIPPSEVYLESSPTKLVEYLSQGLPVLGNREIPFINNILKDSRAGKIVDFSHNSIINGIKWFLSNKNLYNVMSNRAIRYTKENLTYQNIYTEFYRFIRQ